MRDTLKDIKDIKIQGAVNIAKAALKDINGYGDRLKFTTRGKFIKDVGKRVVLLKKTRPTEPEMQNVLDNVMSALKENKDKDEMKLKKRLYDFCKAELQTIIINQKSITEEGSKIFESGTRFLIHCHSHTVVDIIKSLENPIVITTETRPRMQGRITAKDLIKVGIDTTEIVDDAIADVIDDIDCVLVGSDAITAEGIINKVGTRTIAEIAKLHKKPFYAAADMCKVIKKIPIEMRSSDEVWTKRPKKMKIRNFAFDITPWKYVTGVITEKGVKKKRDFKF